MKQLAILIIIIFSILVSTLYAQEKYPLKQLTFDPAQEGFPSWSQDGKTIVYTHIVREDSSRMTGLWKVSADGGKPWQFTDLIGEHPDWSPDGHYIVFDADSGNSIKLVSSQGGKPIRIVPETIPVFRGGNPCWSPDGSQIAFKESANLYLLDVQTGKFRNIFHEEGKLPIACCWSLDGKYIYVNLRSTKSQESTLWKISTAGEKIQQLTFKEENFYRYMDLSPDGSLLAIVSKESGNFDIWIMPAEGGNPIQLTFHPAMDDTPRWSPDGKKIAFTSTRSDNFEVWVMELDIEKLKQELKSVK